MTPRVLTTRLALASLCLILLPALAAAGQPAALPLPAGTFVTQPATVQASAAAADAQGPMIVEPVHNGFVAAPEFQIGRIGGRTADFAGAYGGLLFDNRLLIGAAGYGLTNGSRTRGMAYGGALVQWLTSYDDWLGFGLRGLVGGGEATLPTTITVSGYGYPFFHDWRTGQPIPPPTPQTLQVGARRGFFIFQPQADLRLKLASRIHLNWGIGYRAVAGAGSFNSQLRGVSGSVGLEVGLW